MIEPTRSRPATQTSKKCAADALKNCVCPSAAVSGARCLRVRSSCGRCRLLHHDIRRRVDAQPLLGGWPFRSELASAPFPGSSWRRRSCLFFAFSARSRREVRRWRRQVSRGLLLCCLGPFAGGCMLRLPTRAAAFSGSAGWVGRDQTAAQHCEQEQATCLSTAINSLTSEQLALLL